MLGTRIETSTEVSGVTVFSPIVCIVKSGNSIRRELHYRLRGSTKLLCVESMARLKYYDGEW